MQLIPQILAQTHVYELIHNSVPVFRRLNHVLSINATQVLTLSGIVDKGHRARILDDKIAKGWKHEKIQGGAGKFQGTWIDAAHALMLAEEFGVERYIRQLVDFVPPSESDASAWKPSTESPRLGAQQISVAKRRRRTQDELLLNDADISFQIKRSPRLPHSQTLSESGAGASTGDIVGGVVVRPVRKRINTDSRNNSEMNIIDTQALRNVAVDSNINRSFTKPTISKSQQARITLLNLFLNSDSSPSSIPPKIPLCTPLDPLGNTVFHYATTLGHIPLLKFLITRASSSKDLDNTLKNSLGETPLMRAVCVPNTFNRNCIRDSLSSFSAIIPLQKHLQTVDLHGKSVFHHAIYALLNRRVSEEICVYYLLEMGGVMNLQDLQNVVDGRDWKGRNVWNLVKEARSGGGRVLKVLKGLLGDVVSDSANPEVGKMDTANNRTDTDMVAMDTDTHKEHSCMNFENERVNVDSSDPEEKSFEKVKITVPAGNPEFVKKATNAQNGTLTLLSTLSNLYTTSINAHTRDCNSIDTQLTHLNTKVLPQLRHEHRMLRTQNLKISEIAYRIGVIERAIVEEEGGDGDDAGAGAVKSIEDKPDSETRPTVIESETNPVCADEFEIDSVQLESKIEWKKQRITELNLEKTRLRLQCGGIDSDGGSSDCKWGKDVEKMRRIIAFSCRIPVDQVDSYLEPLIAALKPMN